MPQMTTDWTVECKKQAVAFREVEESLQREIDRLDAEVLAYENTIQKLDIQIGKLQKIRDKLVFNSLEHGILSRSAAAKILQIELCDLDEWIDKWTNRYDCPIHGRQDSEDCPRC